MWNPDLIQATRTRRDNNIGKAVIAGIITLAVLALLSISVKAEDIAVIHTDVYELNKYVTEVGKAPGVDTTVDTTTVGGTVGSVDGTDVEAYLQSLYLVPEEDWKGERWPDGFMYLPEIPLDFTEQRIIFNLTHEAGIPWELALGIIDKETNGTFDKAAVNHQTHDYGLWQINRGAWFGKAKRMLGISTMDDLLDVRLNTQMGVFVLSDCINRYGMTEKALIAYNAGWANSSSNAYSRDVIRRRDKWAAVMYRYDSEEN